MSAAAAGITRAGGWGELLARVPREAALRVAAFAGLAAFVCAHWATLVADPPVLRMAVVVLVASGLAAGLSAIAAAPMRRRPAKHLAAFAAFVLALALALAAAGMPVRLLPPGAWDELGPELDRGLSGIRTVEWPYGGDEGWVRLVILLAAPATLVLAAALAFWPVRRGADGAARARAHRAARALRHGRDRARSWRAADPGAGALPARGRLAVAAAAAGARGQRRRSHRARRGSPGPAGGRPAERRDRGDRLHVVELVRREGRDLRLEPQLRAARLVARGHHPAPGEVRQAAVLEGGDARQLRRPALGAQLVERPHRSGRGAASGSGPALGRELPRDRPLAADRLRDRRRYAVPRAGRGRRHQRLRRRHDPPPRRAARARRQLPRARLRAGPPCA